MGNKMRITREDYLKANRKASREEEIVAHGHSVRIGGVHKSKKVYDRKRSKAEMKKALPYFLVLAIFRKFGMCYLSPCYKEIGGYLKELGLVD